MNADKGQIEQVLLNLVINASDAMPMGGKLSIQTANVTMEQTHDKEHMARLQPPGNYSILVVSDNGPGMDEDTITILVVEDEKIVRNIVCEALTVYGNHVIEAVDGADGLRLATINNDIDLLLTDVIMPQKNGLELYQEVIQVLPNIKVLFMSDYTDDIVLNHGLLSERGNFIQKQFSVKSLIENIRLSLIDNAHPENRQTTLRSR